jgi:thiamine-monophosphate kinase
MRSQSHNEQVLLRKIAGGADLRNQSQRISSVSLGIGDDAALFRPRTGHETILTCDWFVEGSHFLRELHPPDSVGWKCLARAVSDVAAMGGLPKCFLLSLALPPSLTRRWLDLFLGGLRRASRRFGCVLAGGDTTRRNEILINISVIGEVRSAQAIRRSGGKAGDIVCVSGRLGEAALGLQALKSSKGRTKLHQPLMHRHLYPEPRLALGQWLAKRGLATAMMDLSDGLSSDLPRLCAASGVGAQVEIAKLPVAQIPNSYRKLGIDPLRLALDGGDDYELLFTARPDKLKVLPRVFRGVLLTPVGTITPTPKLILREESGRERKLLPRGWDPFRTAR